jgi:hypothetical protein
MAGEKGTHLRFVDWDTGRTFCGEMMPCPEDGREQVLRLYVEGGSQEGLLVDRRSTGSIAILEASGEELLSLENAGYRLSID